MLDQSEQDAGTIAALMIRFTVHRLPRAERLLEKVNGGDKLSDDDILFLKRVDADCKNAHPLFNRNPKYQELFTTFIGLYTEIINKGLENENL